MKKKRWRIILARCVSLILALLEKASKGQLDLSPRANIMMKVTKMIFFCSSRLVVENKFRTSFLARRMKSKKKEWRVQDEAVDARPSSSFAWRSVLSLLLFAIADALTLVTRRTRDIVGSRLNALLLAHSLSLSLSYSRDIFFLMPDPSCTND